MIELGWDDSDDTVVRFREVVNLSARELNDWLCATCDLPPGQRRADPCPLGLAVLAVLSKRRADLTPADLDVMRKVIGFVGQESDGVDAYDLATDDRRRCRLLNVGHDPLRAFLTRSDPMTTGARR